MDDPVTVTFRPWVRFNKDADSLTAYFRPDSDYSEQLNEHITLYRSLDSGEVVGVRFEGVSEMLAVDAPVGFFPSR